jgi:hypothetical protein
VRWSANDDVTIVDLLPAFDEDGGTAKVSAELDLNAYAPGSRFLIIMSCEGAAGNTGGTWKVEEAATAGGALTTSTTDGSLTATGTSTDNVMRTVALRPNRAKPFVKVTFTDTDASTDAYISVTVVVLPRVL